VKNILVAIESCETTTIASPIVQKTIELAVAFSSKVWLLHVAPRSRQAPYNIDRDLTRHEIAEELRHEREFLQQLAKCMQDKHVDAHARLVRGSITGMILQEAEHLAADLVILGCHRHGRLYGALLDDTEESLLSKCARPLMFIPS
jgi:nucleotide-binding universal stress UspA family protein